MNFDEVKRLIKQECKDNEVNFYHGRGKTVLFFDGIRSNGYFFDGVGTDDGPTLAVATNENTLTTLVHEYCHMQQFLEQAEVWTALRGNAQIWEWLSGDEFSDKVLDASIELAYAVELDCEKRSIRQHRIWNTGIDISEYIQKSNAYTMFYFFMRHHRVWYKQGREPYSVEEVWSQMPKSFTFDRDKCYNKVHQLFNLCI